MHIGRRINQKLWRWYLVLLFANGLDLLFTYFGVSRGYFHEANPLLRPYIDTPWLFVAKMGGMGLLALVLAVMLRTTQWRVRLVVGAVQITAGLYGIVILMHLLYLLTVVGRV